MPSFIEKLTQAIERNDSLLCVGLDPDVGRIDNPSYKNLVRWSTQIIEQTSDLVCCYKPNFAFYEQFGPEGLSALQKAIAAIPNEIPVLLDAKRGDIGSTATAYARAAFYMWKADAITISPYLGQDSVMPFLDFPGKTVFLLCQTSNPSAAEIQNLAPQPLYRHIAQIGQTWGDASQIGFVVGATRPEALSEVRALAPDRWLLAPGIGAQGGDLSATLAAGLDSNGSGLIIPASRAVIYADNPRQAARNLQGQINAAKKTRQETPRSLSTPHSLISNLYTAGCIKFGQFTLASGKQSPIYIDLRRAISYPDLFQKVSDAYIGMIHSLQFDCLAAVPYAALPVSAAVALKLKRPLIYPRKEVKTHGTGQAIEGAFEAGHTALVIEDVVTSGGSILAAIKTLEQAGLTVRDIAVLVDREQTAKTMLAEQGYRLHAVLTLSQMVDTLHDQGQLAGEMYQTVKNYLAAHNTA